MNFGILTRDRSVVMGFSHSTCTPRSTAFSVCSMCSGVDDAMITASRPGMAIMSSNSANTWTPCGSRCSLAQRNS